jgi:hypothetical protein
MARRLCWRKVAGADEVGRRGKIYKNAVPAEAGTQVPHAFRQLMQDWVPAKGGAQ